MTPKEPMIPWIIHPSRDRLSIEPQDVERLEEYINDFPHTKKKESTMTTTEKTCEWKRTRLGNFITLEASCKVTFSGMWYNPGDKSINYCPNCGGKIVLKESEGE